MIVPVILAGGSGTRLWPLSRQAYPKQFLKLVDEQYTMLQLTIKRLDNLKLDVAPPIIICNEDHRFIVAEQLRQIGIENASIVLEPYARNTAPAIGLATLLVKELYPDNNISMLVLSADHDISDIGLFHQMILKAYVYAQKGRLIVFGVEPTVAHTGYGYIECGSEFTDGEAFELKKFVEKPDKITAEKYLLSRQYLWNSGMFMFGSDVMLNELKAFRSDIMHACEMAWAIKKNDVDFIRIDAQAFKDCPEDSIDYAVMEKTKLGAVFALTAKWSDLGTWQSLWKSNLKDDQQNVSIGDVIIEDSHHNYINSTSRLVTILGVENLIIVETKDAVLVAHQDKSEEIKKVVSRLKNDSRCELQQHKEVSRPWGKYDCVDIGERYQVKRITVNPKARLSLQLHHHRAEHWVVVKGTAKVIKGLEEYYVSENESTFIPLGTTHSLENPGCIPLELIEIQSGSYLGEDDIVRLKDNYGRV